MNETLAAELAQVKAENARLKAERELAQLKAENLKLNSRQAARQNKGRQPLVTKEWLAKYITTQPQSKVEHMVGRALVAIYRRQTRDEQENAHTAYQNGVGFRAGGDDKAGTAAAEWYLVHGSLLPEHLTAWTAFRENSGLPRLCAYSRQLNEIAWEVQDATNTEAARAAR